MATIHDPELSWHPGERDFKRLLHVPEGMNPTSFFLTPRSAHILEISPLIAIGTLDQSNNPWTTIWGGEPGFSRPIGQTTISIRALIDRTYDPVVEALFTKDKEGGEAVKGDKMVGGLSIILQRRLRAKLFGRMIGGKVGKDEEDGGTGEVQLAIRIEQSLGMAKPKRPLRNVN
jgi:hypothetical protein